MEFLPLYDGTAAPAYLVKSKALERISEKDQRAMDNVAVEPIKSGYVKP